MTVRLADFDTWRPGYGAATVTVYVAGTTTPADIFTDEALTVAASNPQTLQSTTINGIVYGKWQSPLYTSQSVELDIDGNESTGIIRPPLTSLDDANAGNAEVTPVGGSVATDLDDLFARIIDVRDYGEFKDSSEPDDSASTNNTTLTAAIGIAAAAGGGIVEIPAGTFKFTSVTLSGDVILRGRGRDATTLESETADKVITLGGDQSGFIDISIDGVSVQPGSTGIYGLAKDETIFNNVKVERFETGLHFQGGRRAQWADLYIDACTNGAKLHGDADTSGTGNGDEYRHNLWNGGLVSNCTTLGVELSYEDKKVWHNSINDVGFETNAGTALQINGARFTTLDGCWWTGNTTDLVVQDDDDTDNSEENTVVVLNFLKGSFSGGAITLKDTCQDVVFEQMELSDIDVTLTGVTNNILVQDCIEDADLTLSGDTEKWTRWRRFHNGTVTGRTADGNATKAWGITLAPGQQGILEAQVTARNRVAEEFAHYRKVAKVSRPGSTLAYDNQTANFTAGQVVTGGTSGATALIVADSDSGTTGTLTLHDITGVFENNETITDPLGGSALANGTLSANNAVIDQADTIGSDHEDVSGWNSAFAVATGDIELRVTGATGDTVDWTVNVRAVLS